MDRLCQKIFEACLYMEGVYDPSIFRSVSLSGSSGAGKSFVGGKVTGGHGLKLVNSDVVLEYLLKKHDVPLDFRKLTPEQQAIKDIDRTRAKQVYKNQLDMYIQGRLGLLLDGTGANYDHIKKTKDRLEELGYETFMIFVNASLETSLKRNSLRDRNVPDEIVKDRWAGAQKNLAEYASLFGSNFVVVDNDKDDPDSVIFDEVWKRIMKFVHSPISSTVAKEWIRNQGGKAN